MQPINEDGFSRTDKDKIKSIVRDELKSVMADELRKEINKALKSKDHKDDMVEIVKKAFTSLYKFMWIKKTIWQNDIRV